MKRYLTVISFVIMLAGCEKKDTTDPSVALQTNFTNVQYGADAAQVMDIYLPPNRSTAETRVMVLIHGGGWTSGDKSDFSSFIDTIQRRLPHYAIFNINYRLASGTSNLFPTQENDVRSAIQFIYSKREAYGISDNYALLGASAGAHLALLNAYKDTIPVRVRTVIDYFGPSDMTAMFNNPAFPGGDGVVAAVMGATPSTNSTLYWESSPINFIRPNSSATIIFHGDLDNVVRHEQSDSLYARLDSLNVSASIKIYQGQAHGFVNDTLSNSFDRMQVFLVNHMQ